MYVSDLVQRAPEIFLERHGHHLPAELLVLFDPLAADPSFSAAYEARPRTKYCA